MSESKLISPMLDNFMIGDPISDRNGVRSCPAMNEITQDKYIVKIISSPSSPAKLEALLLSGAYADREAALSYFQEMANDIAEEAGILEKLSNLEGFVPFESTQIVPMDDHNGYDVYLLSSYKRSLARQLQKAPLTHLAALNLGLDICSALSVCRRSGYLFVNLKPENIYCVGDNGYRIGDLGFVKLDSLKYTSLPDRYRSAYTAPEISDAFSSLNTTLDVYAAGLVLYQVFNGGHLPEIREGEPLRAPDYADYEMAEIILKACAVDPQDRWQDPVEMGQALVSYMQRNGAHDTPIVSQVVVSDEPAVDAPLTESEEPASIADEDSVADEVITSVDNVLSEDNVQAIPDEEPAPEAQNEEVASDYAEDSFGNLSFLTEDDETVPGMDMQDMDLDQVSVEISDILNQVDELVSHPTPDPVIPPEPIDVPVPPVDTPAEDVPEENVADPVAEQNSDEADSKEEADEEPNDEVSEETTDEEEPETEDAPEEEDVPAKPKRHWLRNTLLVLMGLALIAGGFLFYKFYYLLPVDSITLEGNETELTVIVESKINEELLIVVCSDTYGNQRKAPVVDGKAVFKDLAPDAAYTVKLEASNSFHRVTGDITSAYTTPVQTNIAHFSAVTGQTEGSVVLRFTVEGPEPAQWKVTYATTDEESKDTTFTGNMVEITGLTVGKQYTFTLSPAEDLFYAGITEITHTVSKLIFAEDLAVNSFADGKLTVSWSAPKNTSVASWTVHCYNDNGVDETIVTNSPTATFDNIASTSDYNLEVTADGMSVSQRIFINKDALSVTDLKLVEAEKGSEVQYKLVWNHSNKKQKWVVLCVADGVYEQKIATTDETSVDVPWIIPGAKHRFVLQTADGDAVIGGTLVYTAADAQDFDNYNITKANVEIKMCHTPSKKNWDHYDLSSSDYTTTFSTKDKASFVLHLDKKQKNSSDKVTTTIVIRDEAGNIVSCSANTEKWKSIWSNRYSEFNISNLPGAAGKYNLSVYFNNGLAATQDFTVN